MEIRFGTDGWRAVIAKEFTFTNVERVVEATAHWLKQKYPLPKVMVGYDCRFMADEFARFAAQKFASMGVKVYLSPKFVSTPMVSYAVVAHQAHLGVVLTASHNPPTYLGYKLKAPYGGPAPVEILQEIEALIPALPQVKMLSYDELLAARHIEYYDMEALYLNYLKMRFEIPFPSPVGLVWDVMYGAGQRIVPKVFPQVPVLRAVYNPSFEGIPPEPIEKNLYALRAFMESENVDLAFVLDGDADRLGMMAKIDGKVHYIDAHHIILLALHYLVRYGQKKGPVVASISCTTRIPLYAARAGLPCTITPVGFKYIAAQMQKEEVLLGAEESGGLAFSDHLPERDGLYAALLILEMLRKTQKTLPALIEEIYQVVGRFVMRRWDGHVTRGEIDHALHRLSTMPPKEVAGWTVEKIETLDGYKLLLSGGRALMFRASGTEPIIRVYAEGNTPQEAEALIAWGKDFVTKAE
ncbi:MAG: phosphoglucomutase/phosphomannomutase family protein [Bacteroidia bacterium]